MSDKNEKNYMLVQDGCGACDEAKELLKDDIKRKKIVVFDIMSGKGLELAEKHEVDSVPTFINEKDKFQQKCYLSESGKQFFCEDGTIKELNKKIKDE